MKEEKSQRASIIGQIAAAAAAAHPRRERRQQKIIAQHISSLPTLISGRARSLPPSLLNPIKRGNPKRASIGTFYADSFQISEFPALPGESPTPFPASLWQCNYSSQR
jgi:hypothetical protein